MINKELLEICAEYNKLSFNNTNEYCYMNKLLLNLFDRFIFTFNFIIGVQLPEFMQQYLQRLSGHLTEANFQLQQFQHIADIQFNGNLSVLIERYGSNTDVAIQRTGQLIENLATRVTVYEQHIQHLQHGDYLQRLTYFVKEVNLSMAKATIEHFQLAIPLQPNALATGLVFAISIIAIQALLVSGVKWLFRKMYYPKCKNRPVI